MWKKYIWKLRWPYLLATLLLALYGVAEAGVTLVPRVNAQGNIIAGEDYVLFGKFKHRLKAPRGDQEAVATPILWRAMSLDISPNPTKATLLSHHLLEAMSRQHEVFSVNSGSPGDPYWYRSPDQDPHINANQWDGSEVQKWLNDTSQTTAYFVYLTKNYYDISPEGTKAEGFLHGFADEERNALLPYPDGVTNSKVSLPSGWLENWLQPATRQGEITLWFEGGNEAYYKKSDVPTYPRDYWTRSPVSSYTGTHSTTANTLSAWRVLNDGDKIEFAPVHEGDKEAYAVRPVLLLDLGALLFKAASDDFDLSSAPALGGVASNPWVLVLSELAPLDWTIAFQSADIRPQSAAIDTTGKIMTVTWAGPISPAVQHWPASADFTLTRSGVRSNPISVTSSDVDNKILTLTFASATFQGEAVTLGYNLNTDAISCDVTTTPQAIEIVGSFADFLVTNHSTVPPPDPGPTPSSETKPGSVSTTAGGTKYDGGLQPDGKTFLITVPHGTDISDLPVNVTPPKGGSVSPDMPVSHDFTKGPLVVTVTAEDGTKKDYTITVKVEEQKSPTERTLFTINVNACEIVVTRNDDGSYAVEIRIPFASASDADLLDLVRMIASSLNLTNVSYSLVNTDGNKTPVTPLQSARGATTPYLEISGTAANMSAIENGAITQIRYTLKNDATQYVQMFPGGGLKISSMPGYPSPEPTPGGGGSSGCNASGVLGTFTLIALAGVAMRRRKT